MLQLKTVTHFGVERRYFADARIQAAYVALTERKTVSDEMLAFLRAIGVGVSE